jgi:DNA sulfur modification protein DndC
VSGLIAVNAIPYDSGATRGREIDFGAGPLSNLRRIVDKQPDMEIRELFRSSARAFAKVHSKNFPRWVLTFSGGKDSTLTLILALDYLLEKRLQPRVDVVYSDTLMEIPAMRRTADQMLAFIRGIGSSGRLNVRIHVVTPKIEERFWYCVLGRGYPPPKPKFRWCTKRLKIAPAAPIVSTGSRTAVLTGVRFGESTQRTARLVASCATGGECGQDFWFRHGPVGSNLSYFAPIVQWRTCKVWDFLHFVAPEAGWPTEAVYELYGDTSLRFGCWSCTLVRRDRTMEALAAAPGGEGLSQLTEFRDLLLATAAVKENRLMRNGHVGPFRLEVREKLLGQLLKLEKTVGRSLIAKDEVNAIRAFWARDSFARSATR